MFLPQRGNLSREYERELFDRQIQIGADGSILLDGDHVYVLNVDFVERVDRIDYFHGICPHMGGVPEQVPGTPPSPPNPQN